LLLMTTMSNSRKHGILLRCHAFASNANRQQKQYSRSFGARWFQQKRKSPLVIRGGGSQSFLGNSLLSSETESTTRLSSTTSPSRESSSISEEDEFEKRVLESLAIASGGPIPTSINSFGGLTYQDTSSPKSSSLFRVVFVLGGPGKTFVN
jgi:hypothetical protein